MAIHRSHYLTLVVACLFTLSAETSLFGAARQPSSELTYTEAQTRSAHVKNVAYKLQVELTPDLPDYSGQVTTTFQYFGAKAPLNIDFEGGSIGQLSINGKNTKPDYNGHFLTLPSDSIKNGDNEVVIQFKQPFSPAARGLYRFKDPEDGRIYLYTDFEPYFANRYFPCFDQPDLKAKMKLTVTAPEDWSVVSTTIEESKSSKGKGIAEWTFPETPPMSTYLYALHAGQYHIWKDDKRYPVPLRLFARESVAKYVDASYWFMITRQGLDYYNDYFDYPYAFKKYDQIIVPDFNSGAMENIAAITFSERFISRGKMTFDEKQSLANVILHEMAHQWFGNLVTMRWWNDLWLNESFADFMASQSLVGATEFKDAWLDFSSYSKRSAYYEDQLVTTHAIATHVADTDVAANNFDGITYGKGASALKQLAFTIGPDAFRDGIRDYLKKYQFENATLSDFLMSLQAHAPKFNATRWSKEWLQAAGLNSIKTKIQCSGGKIKSLRIEQSIVSGEKIYRSHTANLALFDRKGKNLELRKSEKISYDGPSTALTQFDGQACPAFIFPNLNDEDYAQIELAGIDLKAAMNYILVFPNAELRLAVWGTLSQMVRDGKLKAETFLDLVLKNIAQEASYTVKDFVIMANFRRSNILVYLPTPGVENSKYEKYIGRFETLFWNQFKAAVPGSDEQALWFETYGNVVESKDGLAKFAKLLTDPTQIPKGFTLDQDRKWDIVRALARQNDPATASLLKTQEDADHSQNGKLAALAIRTVNANPTEKRQIWADVVAVKSKYSQAEMNSIIYEFFPRSKLSTRKLYANDFYQTLKGDLSKRENDWLRAFSIALRPLTCSRSDLDAMKSFMTKHGSNLPVSSYKALQVAMQEDERCIASRHL